MINNLTIRNKDQVMLRVTVVEVARTVLKQFGINVNGSWSGLNLVNNKLGKPEPLITAPDRGDPHLRLVLEEVL